MCGIAGIISLQGKPLASSDCEDLIGMNRRLSHRGPDGFGLCSVGTKIDCRYNVSDISIGKGASALLSHNRLAIFDLNDAALQPFVSRSGKSAIVFNGEVYNYPELARKYGLKDLRTSSDTEVLLELLESHGFKILNELIGMWAFCYYNRDSGDFVLSVDRFGQKPLYYSTIGDKLYFASEMKAFLGNGGFEFSFDDTAVRYYLQHGLYVTPNGSTFYCGIKKVPPSHCLRVRGESLSLSRYYAPAEERLSLGLDDLIDHGRHLFEESISLRSRSDVPLACSLSGGIDSSTVVAFLAREVAPKPLRCYTIDVGDRFENEVIAAKSVAAANGCEHVAHPVNETFTMDEIDDYVFHLEEPQEFLGPIGQSALYQRVAADGYKIILDGQVGDEAFCGYYWFAPHVLREWVRKKPVATAQTFLGYLRNRNASWSKLFFTWKNELFPAVTFRKQSEFFTFDLPREEHFLVKKLAGVRSWRDRQRVAYFDYELQSLLRDADRNSMRHGIENRLPFIDHRIFELTNCCDSLLLIKDGWNKYVSRSFANDTMIPRDVRWNRVKKGFYIEYHDAMTALARRMEEFRRNPLLEELVNFKALPDIPDINLLWRLYNVHMLSKKYILREGSHR